MTQEQAMAFVGELGCLKNFPSWNAAAVDKIAENLANLCPTPRHAQRLVAELTGGRFDEWPGPATVRGVYGEIFPPDRSFRPTWFADGPPPAVNCSTCNDTGGVASSDFFYTLCDQCDEGKTTAAIFYVGEMNLIHEQMAELRERAKQAGRQRIRPADFRAVREAIS